MGKKAAESSIFVCRYCISAQVRRCCRFKSQMSALSTVRITFGFVRGALLGQEIIVEVSSCTTFLQLKHLLIQKHAACNASTHQLKFVCVKTLAILADDQMAGSVQMPRFDITVNVIKSTAQSATSVPAALRADVAFDHHESPIACASADLAQPHMPSLSLPPAPPPLSGQQNSKTKVTGFFAELGLDKGEFSGEFSSGLNMSYEQQQRMSREIQALAVEEAAGNEVDMSKFLSIYENMRKPEDKAIDSVLPVCTLVRLDG
jgi:hypothetical protein